MKYRMALVEQRMAQRSSLADYWAERPGWHNVVRPPVVKVKRPYKKRKGGRGGSRHRR